MRKKLSARRSPRRRRSSCGYGLTYQNLEPRQLLAGDVQVSFLGGTLRVIGDAAANQINIFGTDNGVRVVGVNTTINGVTSPFTTQGSFRNALIQLKAGDDIATVRQLTVKKDFQIFGDNGNDELRLFHVFASRFEAYLGNGDDVLELEDIRTDREFRVFMDAGNDTVASKHVIAGRNAEVFGHSGNDLFASDDFYAKKKFQFDLGAGDDQGIFAGLIDVYKSSSFNLGAGNDLLAFVPAESSEVSNLRGRTRIDMGAGNDIVVVDSSVNVRKKSSINGGAGDDSIHVLGNNGPELFRRARSIGFEHQTVPTFSSLLNAAYASLDAKKLDPFGRGITPTQATKLEFDPVTQYVSVNDASPTVSVQWDKAIQTAVVKTKVGPTIASRAYAMVHTAMYDAWSAYDAAASSTVLADTLQRPAAENTDANKIRAMSYAAFKVSADLFLSERSSFSRLMTKLGFDPSLTSTDATTPTGIGNTMAGALLTARHADGSNQLGNSPTGTSGVAYSDTTGYIPTNSVGNTTVIDKWTPEYVPIDATASQTRTEQHYLTPHWGAVTSFSMSSASAARPSAPEPFLLVAGTIDLAAKTITLADNSVVPITPSIVGTIINPVFIEQANEVITASANLTDKQKLIAEFWEDAGGTSFPPGTWMTFGDFVSARDNHTIDQDAKMFLGLGNAVCDAGIATWESKRFYDYTRPVRAVRELGALGLVGQFDSALGGNAITAWTRDNGVQKILATDFATYQTPGKDASPPFAEYTSGHSAFSAAGAEILKRFTGNDTFGASVDFAVGQSRFEPGTTPAAPVKLQWDTFTAAADEAGVSRIYGGIHFADGDTNGRTLGRSVGELAWTRANFFINGGVV